MTIHSNLQAGGGVDDERPDGRLGDQRGLDDRGRADRMLRGELNRLQMGREPRLAKLELMLATHDRLTKRGLADLLAIEEHDGTDRIAPNHEERHEGVEGELNLQGLTAADVEGSRGDLKAGLLEDNAHLAWREVQRRGGCAEGLTRLGAEPEVGPGWLGLKLDCRVARQELLELGDLLLGLVGVLRPAVQVLAIQR